MSTQLNGHTKPKLPIIDLAPFPSKASDSDASPSEAQLSAARELIRGCREIGFVYIKNHGVPQIELDKVFEVSQQFYDLPLEDKMKAPHPPGWAVHRGYSWPGLEKVSNAIASDKNDDDDKEWIKQLREVSDYKESYEVGSASNPMMPNVWPPSEVLPEWQPTMQSFYWTCFTTARRILHALAIGLDIPPSSLLAPHGDGHYNQLRLLHYPPLPAAVVEDGKFVRMPAHSDWSTFTFLFQDDCGGLQVENPHSPGSFIDIAPVPNTCVLNVGDMLMRWSNDVLKSTQHRVQLPPLQDRYSGDQRLTRARYSIPYFVAPDPDVRIECLKLDGKEPKYEPITHREYTEMKAKMQYAASANGEAEVNGK